MKIDEFIGQFAEAVDDSESESIHRETKFRSLARWDSMAALLFLSMVDEEYGVRISSADLEKCDSVENLFNLIRGQK